MKILFNSKSIIAIAVGVFCTHGVLAEEITSDLPESGPQISIDTEDNFVDLGRACDLENLQMEEIAASTRPKNSKIKTKVALEKVEVSHPCQKLLEADKKFQMQMRLAKCEALDTYTPTEKEIRSCQIDLRKTASNKNMPENYEADIKNRDQCIVKLQSNFCQKSSNANLLGD